MSVADSQRARARDTLEIVSHYFLVMMVVVLAIVFAFEACS